MVRRNSFVKSLIVGSQFDHNSLSALWLFPDLCQSDLPTRTKKVQSRRFIGISGRHGKEGLRAPQPPFEAFSDSSWHLRKVQKQGAMSLLQMIENQLRMRDRYDCPQTEELLEEQARILPHAQSDLHGLR